MAMSAIAQKAFEKFEHEYLRAQEWTDVDVFTLIGNFIEADRVIASALALHAADVLREQAEEVNWTDVIAEVYKRTFFDPAQAIKYGTQDIANDDARVRHFADYLIMQFNVVLAGGKNVVAFEPPQRM